jgi:hypothetical protein
MPSKAELVCIDPSRVREFWPHVEKLIKRAVIRGGGDFADIRRGVLNGPDLLWLAWDGDTVMAAATTRLGTIGDRKICTIAACGGTGWKRFGHMIEGLENFAIGEGCAAVRIEGRAGWSRVLKDYDVRSVVLEKEI